MRRFALVGRFLPHTFSPQYFAQKFHKEHITDALYEAVELKEIDEIVAFVQQTENLKGFNVTIPYKEALLPYLDLLHGSAEQISVVNTVKVTPDLSGNTKIAGFRLDGFNTDAIGFSAEIRPLLRPGMDRALILGDGASAKTVEYVLHQIGIDCLKVSRKATLGTISWSELNDYVIKHHRLIVNTTPIGQFPSVLDQPHIPMKFVGEDHLFFDLIYNPEQTEFLKSALIKGARIQNGMGMLRLQAEKSWEIWNQS
jgi:shikimate dehydrogenase